MEPRLDVITLAVADLELALEFYRRLGFESNGIVGTELPDEVGLYLTVIDLFGLGFGAIVRNTAGGIALFAGTMFVLPALMNVLPTSWSNAASPYLPLHAGERVLPLQGGTLSPWEGFAVLCGYAFAAIAVAAVLLKRRDV